MSRHLPVTGFEVTCTGMNTYYESFKVLGNDRSLKQPVEHLPTQHKPSHRCYINISCLNLGGYLKFDCDIPPSLWYASL